MKNKYLIIVIALLFASCKKGDFLMYEQNAGVYFSQSTFSYSFIEDIGAESKVIKLPVFITGDTTSYDRTFNVAVVEGIEGATATSDMYSIGKGTVLAGEVEGAAEFTIYNSEKLDTLEYSIMLQLVPSDDFPEVRINQSNLTVSFANMIIKPANWNYLYWAFGRDYSTAWWKFIMEVTGRTSMPYNPHSSDKETWYMTSTELKAYQALVYIELTKYNSERPIDECLRHDDGDMKGTPVIMPSL